LQPPQQIITVRFDAFSSLSIACGGRSGGVPAKAGSAVLTRQLCPLGRCRIVKEQQHVSAIPPTIFIWPEAKTDAINPKLPQPFSNSQGRRFAIASARSSHEGIMRRWHGCRFGTGLRAILTIAAMLTLVAAPAAYGEGFEPETVQSRLVEWTRVLDRSAREAEALRLSESDVERLGDQANQVKAAAAELKERTAAQAAEARELLEPMGPQTSGESPETSAQRKDLQTRLSQAEGWERQADLVITRAGQLLNKLSAKRLELFALALATRLPTPLAPSSWTAAAYELSNLAAVLRDSIGAWLWWVRYPESGIGGAVGLGLAGLLFGFGVGAGGRIWIHKRLDQLRGPSGTEPGRVDRVLLAAGYFLALATPLALALLGAWIMWPPRELLPNAVVMAVVYGLATGVVVLLVCRWGIAAALDPAAHGWRVVPISDDDAKVMARRLNLLAGLLAADIAVYRSTTVMTVVDHLAAMWTLAVSVAMAVAFRGVLDSRFWAWASPAAPVAAATVEPDEAETERTEVPAGIAAGHVFWRFLRYVALVALWCAPVVAALGYIYLARYIYLSVVETGLVLVVAASVKRLARAGVTAFDPARRLGRALGATFSIGSHGLRLMQFWLGLGADLVVAAGTLVALLAIWGASSDDLLIFGTRLVEGVRIGSVTLSITDVLLAMLVFVLALAVTRYIQRILDHRVFPNAQLDPGVRHSLRAGVGYLGLFIGIGLSVATLGLNLSNLAIVAGALSVGIGFGLQNIVNNFVSGLILLIERPIKTGDWVVAAGHSGLVRKINVRSTEIETFQRSTVLIPNSEFLSGAVVNWTRHDLTGRTDIPVIVPVASDAAAVKALLLDCAAAHPKISKKPAPRVLLKDFNLTTLQFELQVHVANVRYMVDVASDLRLAIDKAFRTQGIGRPPT
jgi:potassium-dependent mechanosensitive channel